MRAPVATPCVCTPPLQPKSVTLVCMPQGSLARRLSAVSRLTIGSNARSSVRSLHSMRSLSTVSEVVVVCTLLHRESTLQRPHSHILPTRSLAALHQHLMPLEAAKLRQSVSVSMRRVASATARRRSFANVRSARLVTTSGGSVKPASRAALGGSVRRLSTDSAHSVSSWAHNQGRSAASGIARMARSATRWAKRRGSSVSGGSVSSDTSELDRGDPRPPILREGDSSGTGASSTKAAGTRRRGSSMSRRQFMRGSGSVRRRSSSGSLPGRLSGGGVAILRPPSAGSSSGHDSDEEGRSGRVIGGGVVASDGEVGGGGGMGSGPEDGGVEGLERLEEEPEWSADEDANSRSNAVVLGTGLDLHGLGAGAGANGDAPTLGERDWNGVEQPAIPVSEIRLDVMCV